MNFKAIFLLGILAIPLNTIPMGGASRIGAFFKNNSDKCAFAVPATMTGLIVGVNGLIYFDPPYDYIDPDYESRIDEHDRNELNAIRPFIDKEFKKGGIDPDTVKVRFYNGFESYVDGKYNVLTKNILMINRADFYSAGLLKNPLGNGICDHAIDTDKSYEIRATLQHEISHLKHDDFGRGHIGKCFMAISTLGLIKKISNLIRYPLIRAGFMLGSVFPQYGTIKILDLAHSRHREACADEHIPNEPEYLKGALRSWEHLLSNEQNRIQDGFPDINNAKSFAYYWHMDHPTTPSRIARLKERLALLEKEETKQINK